jgi:hypothetical protein
MPETIDKTSFCIKLVIKYNTGMATVNLSILEAIIVVKILAKNATIVLFTLQKEVISQYKRN